ncbi:hypothetical protein AB6D11_06130 [Vibrio splendidus]
MLQDSLARYNTLVWNKKTLLIAIDQALAYTDLIENLNDKNQYQPIGSLAMANKTQRLAVQHFLNHQLSTLTHSIELLTREVRP